jgi:hypothetical protein
MGIRDGRVRAWTGAAMAIPLTRALGPRSTLRVLHSLGGLRHEGRVPVSGEAAAAPVIGRGRFLQLGAGLAVASAMLLTGRLPVHAAESCAAARAWVEANRGRLPETYDEIAARPTAYRRAILEALPPRTRSRLWVEHVQRYRTSHPELTAEQSAVLDRAEAMAATESAFAPATGADLRPRLAGLEQAAVQTLGRDRARALLATFGPPEAATVANPLVPGITGCTCSVDSDYCANGTVCEDYENDCRHATSGCGTFYRYPCDGRCFNR